MLDIMNEEKVKNTCLLLCIGQSKSKTFLYQKDIVWKRIQGLKEKL